MENKTQTIEAMLTVDDMEQNDNKKVQYKTLTVHGAKYRTLYTKKYENRKKWEKPDENKMFSFIPGTISKIFVEKGEKVKKGQRLLILEAMKMMNNIISPMDGIIKKIKVKEGDRIPKGFEMIEFE